jgi:hypothetical protein
MKKHQACFWLNKIAENVLSMRNHYVKARVPDGADAEDEKMTEFRKNQIAELDQQLEAIDMAATALTK